MRRPDGFWNNAGQVWRDSLGDCDVLGRSLSGPVNLFVRIVDEGDFVFFQHGHEDVFEFRLPEFAFVEFGFHGLAGGEVGKAAHEEEGVRIFEGKERAEDLHADCGVGGDRFGAESLKKLRALARFGFVGPHFDNHAAHCAEDAGGAAIASFRGKPWLLKIAFSAGRIVLTCGRGGKNVMRLVWMATLVLVLPAAALTQEAKGPTDAKAQKTFQTAQEWAQRHEYQSAVDSFKKADKQDGGHCEECAYRIVKYGEMIGDYKSADEAAQQLIADASSAKQMALAHLTRSTVQMREGLAKNKADCFAEADREFKLSLASYANNPQADYYDGMALAHLKQDADAKAEFEKFLSLAPEGDVERLRAQRYVDNPELARARMAPAFTVTTLSGEQVSLDGLAGKVVLIDFWATWCGPCREALPHMKEIAQKFSGEPLVVMSISLDNNEAAWKSFVAKNGMTWLQYRDGGFTGPISRLFAVEAIPHTFTIDADGVLQDEHIGDASLEGKLKKLCAQARQRQEAPHPALQSGSE
jgi:thiol-disulfide isomerase/thioredoxin